MLKKLFSFAVLAVIVNALGEEEIWQSFKVKFGKTYDVRVDQKRFSIFRENLQKIEAHNEKYDQGLVSYKMGINKFADLTQGEFAELMGFHGTKTKNSTKNANFKAPITDVPGSINWVDLGAVTGVKDQGGCGSCWGFSATGSIEGQNYLKNNQLISLSEQNLVDCSGAYGNNGCAGGLMDDAFQYVCDYGIMSEVDYPYIGYDETCHFDSTKVALKVTSFVDIQPGSESDLKAAVGTVGPISVAVDASGFQLYAGGVLNDNTCGNDQYSLDHGILAVGYGKTDDGIEYWLVKNSWGADWGENGYIRMSRNKDNQCGIATFASYPVL